MATQEQIEASLVKARAAKAAKKIEQDASNANNEVWDQRWHDVMVAQITNGRCNTTAKFEWAATFADEYIKFAKSRATK